MALTQFTNLNFEDIKTSIKDYLRQNSNFTDFDFEGSNLSVIINTLAYNSYITAYNTNMVVNESFIDSATLRENVVALARNIGYVPRSRRAATATVDYNISGFSTTTATIEFNPGIVANGSVDDTNFIFSIPEKVVVAANGGESFGSLQIYQGQYLTRQWTYDPSQTNQRFVLPNDGIDTSTLRVKIQNSSADTTETEYNLVDNIIGVTSTSNIYLIQETTDEKYELLFGDGVFGKKLQSGNIINASYITSDGPDGNGVANFRFVATLKDDQGAAITNADGEFNAQAPAENGDEIEPVESVKYYAPRLYSSQYRAVTAADYEAILPTIYPNIESVSAYGGEDLNPPQYGRVFIAAKPRNGSFLSDFTKKQLLQQLKNYSVAGIVPIFEDLKYLYVEIDSYVYYNTNFIGDPNNLRSDVVNAITQYANGSELNQFGGRFRYSKTQALIDGVNTAITSNITTVRMRRDMVAAVNQFAQYELCFDNEFYRQRPRYNIKSSGFSIQGVEGTVYFADSIIPPGISQTITDQGTVVASEPVQQGVQIGTLFIFTLGSNNEEVIISQSAGTVNYKTGEILIDTVNITSTSLPENIIEVQAIPLSNDVLARKELYLQLDVAKSNFTMRQDSISSGANTSGTRYSVQSSYQNGKKTR
jgi:hypothetical protein